MLPLVLNIDCKNINIFFHKKGLFKKYFVSIFLPFVSTAELPYHLYLIPSISSWNNMVSTEFYYSSTIEFKLYPVVPRLPCVSVSILHFFHILNYLLLYLTPFFSPSLYFFDRHSAPLIKFHLPFSSPFFLFFPLIHCSNTFRQYFLIHYHRVSLFNFYNSPLFHNSSFSNSTNTI